MHTWSNLSLINWAQIRDSNETFIFSLLNKNINGSLACNGSKKLCGNSLSRFAACISSQLLPLPFWLFVDDDWSWLVVCCCWWYKLYEAKYFSIFCSNSKHENLTISSITSR